MEGFCRPLRVRIRSESVSAKNAAQMQCARSSVKRTSDSILNAVIMKYFISKFLVIKRSVYRSILYEIEKSVIQLHN